MANHLEQLVAEWYLYQGYFVWKNIKVNPLKTGGYKTELDVIAFHPETKRTIHIETSLDGMSFSDREKRYKTKFDLGENEIRKRLQNQGNLVVERQVILLFIRKRDRLNIAGAKVIHVSSLLKDISNHFIQDKKTYKKYAVSEDFPLLRTLQMAFTIQ